MVRLQRVSSGFYIAGQAVAQYIHLDWFFYEIIHATCDTTFSVSTHQISSDGNDRYVF